MKEKIISHIFLPALLSASFFSVALSPVHILGCRTRGLLAVVIALISGFSALGTTIVGAKQRASGDSNYRWWLRSTLILALPVIALLILA